MHNAIWYTIAMYNYIEMVKISPFWEVDFGGEVWVQAGWVGPSESTVAYSGTDVGTKVYTYIEIQ